MMIELPMVGGFVSQVGHCGDEETKKSRIWSNKGLVFEYIPKCQLERGQHIKFHEYWNNYIEVQEVQG